MAVTRANLRAYLDRPWERVREEKDRYTASLGEREGVGTLFRIAADLQAQAVRMGGVETPQEREADLAAAVRLRRLLDRAHRRSRLLERQLPPRRS